MSSPRREVDSIQTEACWKVLERAAASPQLKRAARSREFLFYVAGKSLKDGNTDIHEQEIGHAVFGRDEDYDTSQDNIVRVSATDLRKRIDGYFASDGADEPLIFEIPRGSYSPVFRWRPQEPEPVRAEEVPVAAAVSKTSATGSQRLWMGAIAAAAILLAVCCAVLWSKNQSLSNENRSMHKVLHAWEDQPALNDFWSRFFRSPRETDIILADTSFNLIEDITQQPFSLNDYLDRRYIDQPQPPSVKVDHSFFEMLASRRSSSFGDFRVAEQIEDLDRGSTNVFAVYARDYTPDAIKNNNVILLGGRRSNPWVDLFKDRLNFVLEYDTSLNKTVTNLHPQQGEPSTFFLPADQVASHGFSVIAFLPNASHTANILIIAGTGSQATNAAGDFVTSEASMENLLKVLHAKQFSYFEVLLKTTRLSGTPLSAEVVAYRTY